ncbi:hypothetical protein AR9_g102 [Bacillus phage AR9]|uniref:Uncharacterized protein n=2 Tax=Bacillus phage PBS1 TaxID=10683 RepID=A0A172JI09_BPPB1|nr:hypothetical protein BI022_gp101 [Bacillus phage AR9]YP_009664499.1 hypothetical protein FK780_gp149 [Bacillus phage PBS1]AMS01186.1 hypothetical protein AR9_g102 [Bacillus phage AR9]ASU00120.1 hypothetical protein PBI_PBS1_298 [Bacillus phage PBS1]BDE75371.1 hypothetical protein [Bacillus phage PBS1]
MEKPILVLLEGEYHRRKNILVTTDVRKVAREYVILLLEDDWINYPHVEIWRDGQEIKYFDEKITNEKKLVKILSKYAYKKA